MPRDTWRQVTNAIIVPALWRIFWCLSRPNRTVRSAAINESPWTDTQTDQLTNRPANYIKLTVPGREEISIRRMDFVHSPHYDFELEAICFEPLVSRSLCFVFHLFRLVMFIEAGDVTHRRRGQNRNEGLSKNFQVFTPKKFFDPNLCILAYFVQK